MNRKVSRRNVDAEKKERTERGGTSFARLTPKKLFSLTVDRRETAIGDPETEERKKRGGREGGERRDSVVDRRSCPDWI